MGKRRDDSDVRRPGVSAWTLLGAFWGYAVVVGVLAMGVATLIGELPGDGAGPLGFRLPVALALAVVAGWWSPVLLRLLRQLALRRR